MGIVNRLSDLFKTREQRLIEAEARRLEEERRREIAREMAKQRMEDAASECAKKADEFEQKQDASWNNMVSLVRLGRDDALKTAKVAYYKYGEYEMMYRNKALFLELKIADADFIETGKEIEEFLNVNVADGDLEKLTGEMVDVRKQGENMSKMARQWCDFFEKSNESSMSKFSNDDELMRKLKEEAGKLDGERISTSDDEIKRGVADGAERLNNILDDEDKR